MAYISFQPNDYFNTKLYTGNDASPRSLTGINFSPDFVWLKRRNSASSHVLFDAVRTAGSTKGIASNSNAAEGLSATEGTTANYGYINSFDSDGFSVTTGASNDNFVNNSGDTYVSWNWLANGQGSSNTDGSVTSTVSVSTTSGFSICKFDATGSTMTFGHGLGVKPAVMLIKRTDSNSNGNWIVYHKSVGATKFLTLNDTSAETTASTRFGDTEPTSSLATVGSELLSGGTYIAYCFAQKSGFSSMGSYTGNGNADGTFVFCGFKPAMVILKRSSTAGNNWNMVDNKRNTFNVINNVLAPSSSDAEVQADVVDFTSNGFKLRISSSGWNHSGDNFIYMAFAESPIVSSNGVPATAK